MQGLHGREKCIKNVKTEWTSVACYFREGNQKEKMAKFQRCLHLVGTLFAHSIKSITTPSEPKPASEESYCDSETGSIGERLELSGEVDITTEGGY